jgi:hypothetical protein
MASSNPYEDGDYSAPPPRSERPSAPSVNPYDALPDPIGPDTSMVVKAAEKPYSAFNTVGRMATDALVGLPDTVNMLGRGLNYGIDYGVKKLTGVDLSPPKTLSGLVTGEQRGYDAIPYVAPILRKVVGVAELPEDAGLGRALLEGGGSALLGGVGSAVTRAIGRGVRAAPEVLGSILNPSRPIRRVTEDALEASGNRWYNQLDNLDVRYTPQTGPHMADAINRGAFRPAGITEANAGQAISNVDRLRNVDPTANVPYGTVKNYIVPRDIEDVRQALNRTRTQAWNLPGHREGEAANVAIGGIDRFLQNPPRSAIHPSNLNDPSLVGPVLANARGDTAAAHRLGFLTGTRDEVGTKLAAKANASGSVEAQALRDRAANALNASREGGGPLYGFNDYERQLIERASRASALARYGANAPRSLTGIVAQGGGIGGASFLAGLPHSVSATLAAAIPASEYAAKKLSDWGVRRAYQRAADAVAARSPLAAELGIPAPPTARLPGRPTITRDDLAIALMAPSLARHPKRLEIDTSDWK